MPNPKNARFHDFAASLLPHEVDFLMKIHRLKDPENIQILQQLKICVNNPLQKCHFDRSIDKRKYSHLKKWILEKLDQIDADCFFFKLSEWDQKIMTDAISHDDEIELLRLIKKHTKPAYYFIRFYELVQNYRYYLLIRMRYNYLKTINAFLEQWKHAYNQSKTVNQELHEATADIIDQYAFYNKESKQWETRLLNIFNDETLDGLNRYYAIVRLTFMYYNYKQYDKLTGLYARLDELIVDGTIYSKRILVNYYANRVLLHSRNNETEKAIHYGMLSIRFKGADYIFYVTNLCTVLLRSERYQEALKLMQSNLSEFKQTISPHNRIGFASLYIQSLTRNKKAPQALSFAQGFLSANRDEILQFRWNLFFSSMLYAMLQLEKYPEILRLVRKYKLLSLDNEQKKRASYIPSIPWIHAVAQYKECLTDEQSLQKTFEESSAPLQNDPHRMKILSELAKEIKPHIVSISIWSEQETEKPK